jgi:hypothetical protein
VKDLTRSLLIISPLSVRFQSALVVGTIGCQKCRQFGHFLRPAGSTNGNSSDHIHDLLPSSVLASPKLGAEYGDFSITSFGPASLNFLPSFTWINFGPRS